MNYIFSTLTTICLRRKLALLVFLYWCYVFEIYFGCCNCSLYLKISLWVVLWLNRNLAKLFCRFECRKLVLVGDPKVSSVPFCFVFCCCFVSTFLVALHCPCTYSASLIALLFIFVLFIQQLSPTIQGSEPDHEAGLEQTLFDRLMKMVRRNSTKRIHEFPRIHSVHGFLLRKIVTKLSFI